MVNVRVLRRKFGYGCPGQEWKLYREGDIVDIRDEDMKSLSVWPPNNPADVALIMDDRKTPDVPPADTPRPPVVRVRNPKKEQKVVESE